MSYFIDTHTHLYDEAFNEDFKESVCRAISSGVTKMIFPDIDSTSRERMLECADSYPENIFCGIGLHPTSINGSWKEEIDEVERHLSSGRRWHAVGEIGMDLYWSKEFLAQQREAFDIQICLAESYELPLIIHSRDATSEILDILNGHKGKGLRGIFHAYSGSIETVREIDRCGDFLLGIGGVVTFRKSKLPDIVKSVGLSKLVLETDSPYLTPVPKRGERNESSYIPIIAEKVSDILGCGTEEVADVTSRNASAMFNI